MTAKGFSDRFGTALPAEGESVTTEPNLNVPNTADALEFAARVLDHVASNVPVGSESEQRGSSTYNWLKYVARLLREHKEPMTISGSARSPRPDAPPATPPFQCPVCEEEGSLAAWTEPGSDRVGIDCLACETTFIAYDGPPVKADPPSLLSPVTPDPKERAR